MAEPQAERIERAHADEEEGDADADYGCSKDPAKPVSVAQLRKQDAERKRKAQEAVGALIEFAKAMGKSGASPVQGLVAVLLLRAGLKGLLKAFIFTVVTVLLFTPVTPARTAPIQKNEQAGCAMRGWRRSRKRQVKQDK